MLLPLPPSTWLSARSSPRPRDLAHRLVVTEGGPELAQCHVAGGPAVITFDVLLVDLDGPSGVGQRVAIALSAQVRQAAVAIVDGIAGVQLNGLTVELDGVLVVLGCGGGGSVRSGPCQEPALYCLQMRKLRSTVELRNVSPVYLLFSVQLTHPNFSLIASGHNQVHIQFCTPTAQLGIIYSLQDSRRGPPPSPHPEGNLS